MQKVLRTSGPQPFMGSNTNFDPTKSPKEKKKKIIVQNQGHRELILKFNLLGFQLNCIKVLGTSFPP